MTSPYSGQIAKCCEPVRHPGMDVLLFTKPSNLFYTTGDRLTPEPAIKSRGGN
jgi:hypothetical protein